MLIPMHTIVSSALLHEGGFDAKSIQGWLGQADVATTANGYIHYANENLNNMASVVEETICVRNQ